jgi:hypothetical protein
MLVYLLRYQTLSRLSSPNNLVNRSICGKYGCKISHLPASAFAKDIDDAGEAFAAVVPIYLQGSLDAIWIAVCQGTDDVVVFGDGKLEIADDRTGIETPVALRLGLDRVVPCAETGTGAGDDEPVEVAVYLEDTALSGVVAFDVSELVVEGLQLLHDLHPFGFWKSGRAASSQTFETANDGVKFGRVLFCQRGDDHATFVGHPVLANVTFLLELVEGGAYRSAADVETFGEISFDDPGSGREFAVDDELSQLLERCKNAGAVHESGWAGLGMILGSGGGHRRASRFEAGLILDCTINNPPSLY